MSNEKKAHELKILPQYFGAVCKGLKTFEIRKNDRDFRVGDYLILKEYDDIEREFTGSIKAVRVDYITNYAQQENYVVMSITRV